MTNPTSTEAAALAEAYGILRLVRDGLISGRISEWPQLKPAIETILAANHAAEGTPSSRWAERGEPDPHGKRYDCERAALAGGDMTDDELANAAFLDPNILNLTAMKDRIRWLSRKLAEGARPQASGETAVKSANSRQGED